MSGESRADGGRASAAPGGPLPQAMELVERWLGLADGEGGRAARLLALVFCLSVGLALLKAAQSGIFLMAYPRSTIPWAFAASAVTLASLSLLSVPLAARLGPVRLSSLTLGLSLLVLVALRVLLWMGPRNVPFMLYVLVEAICGLLLIQVWSVVSEATDARSAKRLLPVAGIGATAAWTIGGLIVPTIVHDIGAPGLLLISPVLLLCALALVQAVAVHDLAGRPARGHKRASLLSEWRQGLSFVQRVPLMRLMMVLSVLALITEQLLDYQMMAAARDRYKAPAAVAAFFGTYYGLTSAISLALLLGASGRALGRLGTARALAVVPLATVFAALLVAINPGFLPVVLLRATDRVLKQSLWSSATEQTQTPLPILRRAQARALIRGVIAPAGYAVAALGLAQLPESFNLRWLALVAMGVCCVMVLVIALGISRAYRSELEKSVDDRTLELGEGGQSPLDEAACRLLAEQIRSPDPARASLAAELLRASAGAPAEGALAEGARHADARVRALSLEGLARGASPAALAVLLGALTSDPDPGVRLSAARALRVLSPRGDQAREALARAEHDPDARVRAAARVAGLSLDRPGEVDRGPLLLGLLRSEDSGEVEEALLALTPLAAGEAQVLLQLRDLLVLPGRRETQRLALRAAARLRIPLLLPHVMRLLDDPDLSADATRSLSEWGDEALEPLATSMGPLADAPTFRGQITLTPGSSTGQTLFVRLLSHADSAVRERATRALSRVVSGGRRPPLAEGILEPLLDREIAGAYRLYCVLGGLAHDDGTPDWEIDESFRFLAGEVERRIVAIRHRVLRLLALLGNTRLVRGVEFGLRKQDAASSAKVAELLELTLAPELARKVVPLFDRLSLRERAEAARRIGVFAEEASRDPLGTIVGLGDAHIRGCAMLTYGPRFAERYPLVYEQEAPLLPLFERMTFLRSVPLFGELSGEDLRSVAEIIEPLQYAAGQTIFRKGDSGEDLFLILRGRVAAREGKIELAQLGEREFFGELAVLDREPRSADIVCLEDATLLRLRGVDLGELMSRRPQIYEQILLVLVRRLRSLTERVVRLAEGRRAA